MLSLYILELKDYWYEENLLSDKDTMNYNAGYDVNYSGYHYETGCIDFKEETWQEKYNKRKDDVVTITDAISLMVPYTIGYIILWLVIVLGFYIIGIPIGPGVGVML